jgi:hypothetical protein
MPKNTVTLQQREDSRKGEPMQIKRTDNRPMTIHAKEKNHLLLHVIKSVLQIVYAFFPMFVKQQLSVAFEREAATGVFYGRVVLDFQIAQHVPTDKKEIFVGTDNFYSNVIHGNRGIPDRPNAQGQFVKHELIDCHRSSIAQNGRFGFERERVESNFIGIGYAPALKQFLSFLETEFVQIQLTPQKI